MFTGPFAHPGLKVGSRWFRISRSDVTSRETSGAFTSAQRGTPLWTAGAELPALTRDQALDNEALIESALGSAERFIVTDPDRWYPRAYRKTGLGGRAATASSFSLDTTRTVLSLAGLTPGTVIGPTSLIGFKGGAGLTKRHCVNVLTGGTVSGGGSVTLIVYPAVWAVVSGWAGVVAHLDKPGATMRLTNETVIGDRGADGQSVCTLVAMQDLLV